MPTWSGILVELQRKGNELNAPPFDHVRRKYIAELQQETGRAVILYATKFTDQSIPAAAAAAVTINEEDLQGLMEVVHGISQPKLDLILHSPGGSLEAAEALVIYLRSKFDHIRVIVPHLAMSAATMIACAANEIMLGKHSFLGPTDPQLLLETPLGRRMVSAQAILEQFRRGQEQCADPGKLGAWLPMLAQYGPELLVACDEAITMSKNLVEEWLKTYMFGEDETGPEKAATISGWISSHEYFLSHGRHLSRQTLEERGLVVAHLECDQRLQDLVLSVFHATTHTFGQTTAVKIIENHLGKAFIKQLQPMPVLMPPQPVQIAPPQPVPAPAPGPPAQ